MHLAADLVFAHDDRLEPGADREQVANRVVAVQQFGVSAQLVGVLADRAGQRFENQFGGSGEVGRERVVDIQVGLEPVTGGQHDRAANGGAGGNKLDGGR